MTRPTHRVPDGAVLARFGIDGAALSPDRVDERPPSIERWTAAYWTGAIDDEQLQRWCDRILGGRP